MMMKDLKKEQKIQITLLVETVTIPTPRGTTPLYRCLNGIGKTFTGIIESTDGDGVVTVKSSVGQDVIGTAKLRPLLNGGYVGRLEVSLGTQNP